jgi:hypothetical protein
VGEQEAAVVLDSRLRDRASCARLDDLGSDFQFLTDRNGREVTDLQAARDGGRRCEPCHLAACLVEGRGDDPTVDDPRGSLEAFGEYVPCLESLAGQRPVEAQASDIEAATPAERIVVSADGPDSSGPSGWC